MKRLKQVWKDNVWSKIIAQGFIDIFKTWIWPGIIGVLGLSASYFAGWWPIIGQWLFSKSEISNWLLSILCCISLWKLVEVILKFIYLRKPVLISPPWKYYTKDTIDGIVFRWRYNSYWEIARNTITLHCPNPDCDSELFLHRSTSSYEDVILKCERCNEVIFKFSGILNNISEKDFIEIFKDGMCKELERNRRKKYNL